MYVQLCAPAIAHTELYISHQNYVDSVTIPTLTLTTNPNPGHLMANPGHLSH